MRSYVEQSVAGILLRYLQPQSCRQICECGVDNESGSKGHLTQQDPSEEKETRITRITETIRAKQKRLQHLVMPTPNPLITN